MLLLYHIGHLHKDGMNTPKDLKVALESLKECKVSSILKENKIRLSKG